MLPFLISNLTLGCGAWFAARALPHASGRPAFGAPALQILTMLALFLVEVTVILLAAGHLGVMRPWPVASGALVLGGVLTFAARRRTERVPCAPMPAPFVPWLWPALFTSVALIPVIRLIGYGTGYFSDDFGYHALAVVNWLREGRLVLMPPGFTSYYPLGSELVSLWFCLPFGHDGWAGLAGMLWAALTAAAFVSLGETLRARWAGWLGAALALASTQVAWQLRTFSSTDLAAAAALLAATVLAVAATDATVRPSERKHPALPSQSRLPLFALVGATAGLALGVKISVAPALAVIGLCVIVRTKSPLAGLGFGLGALVVGGSWYLASWRLTGNPFFPAELGPFAGPLTKTVQRETTLLHVITTAPHAPGFWREFLKRYADWPAGIALLSLLGYAVPSRRGAKWWFFAAGALLLLLHPVTPFSHGDGIVNGLPSPYPRYILPSFFAGLAMLVFALTAENPLRHVVLALCLAALALACPWRGITGLAALAAGASLAALFVVRGGKFAVPVLALIGAFALPAVPLLADRQHSRTAAGLAATGADENKPIGTAWAALGQLPPGTRLACFSHSPYHRSPLYAPRLDLDPVFLLADGLPWPHLHREFQTTTPTQWSFKRDETPPDAPTLRSRLAIAAVSHVLISKWPRDTWPQAYELLRDAGTMLFDDGYSVLIRLR